APAAAPARLPSLRAAALAAAPRQAGRAQILRLRRVHLGRLFERLGLLGRRIGLLVVHGRRLLVLRKQFVHLTWEP
ncbi:hypothetical protein, partial [Actinocorallia lasiicapitis]